MHQGLLLDMITDNALIRPLPQRALELFWTMLHQGLLPDVITYNALISACEKGTLPQRALEIFRQCCTKASRQT